MKPTEKEIEKAMYDATEIAQEGSKYLGMTYEQGIQYALEWVLGQGDNPLED